MSKENGGAGAFRPHEATPIIGQQFLEQDIPARYRKLPQGLPLPLAGMFHGDKEQMNRIEAKLDQVLQLLAVRIQDQSRDSDGAATETKS